MILPLPRLQPGWLISETNDPEDASFDAFVARLSNNRWNVLRLPGTSRDLADAGDLLFVDLTTEKIPAALDETIGNALKQSVPILFHGPAELITKMSKQLFLRPMLLTPGDLPHWWGPERMDEELIRTTPPLPITSVTLGRNWAIVETSESIGLAAMTHPMGPPADQAESVDPMSMIGMPLNKAAAGLRELVGMRRTIACAAVNAAIPPSPDAVPGDGLLSDEADPDRTTVIVGRFPALQTKRPDAIVLEMSPGPEDMPAGAAPHVLPGAGELLITASAWCNGTLPGLLRLAREVPVTLVGPGTPLTPTLHAYGIKKLAGFRIIDRDAVRSAIASGGGVKAFKEFGEQIVLSAD
ncbi:DUF364 domain-containing protein [Nisaea sp.]|uniref:Rossmann-like domain-containing protein n=1 Tax=Nisaea sp. TaxID=2024842 RepID=UPI00326355EF